MIKRFNEYINENTNYGFIHECFINENINEGIFKKITNLITKPGEAFKAGLKAAKTLGSKIKDAWDNLDVEDDDIFDPKKYAANKGTTIGMLLINDKKEEAFFTFAKVLDTGEEGYWITLPGSDTDKAKMTAISKGGGDMICIIQNLSAYKKDGKITIRFIVKTDKNNYQIIKQNFIIKGIKIKD